MSKFKKIWAIMLLLCLIAIFLPTVKAKEITTYDDTNQHYFTTTNNEITEMYGVTWNKITGKTSLSEQYVNLFSMKADGVSSKLVVWSPQYQNWRNNRTTLTKLAANYEKNHPGWKVVAGINADQYIMDFGTETITKGQDYYEWQPYYPIIMDGERRFPYTMTATSSNAIAFTNDGSSNGFIDVNNVKGLSLEILDESGVILSKHAVEGVNNTPSATGTTVWFSYVNQNEQYEAVTVNSSKNLYIISNAELAYMSNSRTYTYKGAWAIDSVFGRGTIDQVANSFTLNKGQFVIDTNDSELLSKLDTNVRVRVQYDYHNEALNNVEAASGYHSVQRLNGKDMGVSGSYNTSTYSRSVFGIKEDGTYVLMTADMTTNKKIAGLNGWEVNALLKQHDVVTAYQDDGGGSVTAIFRNKDGGFDLVNTPRDGGERSNLSGLFFVVKDSGVTVDSVDATADSLTLNVNTDNADMNKIKKLYCTLNGVKAEVVNNKVTFNGLNKMTDYSYFFSYDTANATDVDAMLSGVAKTSKTKPVITDMQIEIKANKVIFNPVIDDPDEAFEYIRIVVGDQRYPYLYEPIEVPFEEGLTKLEYVLTYSYDLKDGKDKVIIEENKVLQLVEDDPVDPVPPVDEPTDPVPPVDEPTDPVPPVEDPNEPNDPVEDPEQPVQPSTPSEPEKKGCKKDLLIIVSSFISLATVLVLFRKRK